MQVVTIATEDFMIRRPGRFPLGTDAHKRAPRTAHLAESKERAVLRPLCPFTFVPHAAPHTRRSPIHTPRALRLMSAALSSVRANPVRVAAPAARRATAQRAAVRVCAAGKSYKLTLLPGDGIGPEIMKVAVDCLNVVVRAATAGPFPWSPTDFWIGSVRCRLEKAVQPLAAANAVAPFRPSQSKKEGFELIYKEALIGGAAIDATGVPLPDATLETCKSTDAVLLAAIGGCAAGSRIRSTLRDDDIWMRRTSSPRPPSPASLPTGDPLSEPA